MRAVVSVFSSGINFLQIRSSFILGLSLKYVLFLSWDWEWILDVPGFDAVWVSGQAEALEAMSPPFHPAIILPALSWCAEKQDGMKHKGKSKMKVGIMIIAKHKFRATLTVCLCVISELFRYFCITILFFLSVDLSVISRKACICITEPSLSSFMNSQINTGN